MALLFAGLAAGLGLLAGSTPTYALLLSFGLVFAAIALVNLTVATCCFAVLTFVDEVIPAAGLPLTKLMGAILVISWIGAISVGDARRRRLREDKSILYLLALFVLWAGLSAVWAADSGSAIDAVFRYLPNAMLFPIVYTAASTRSKALWIIGALVAATLISALYGTVIPVEPEPEGRLSGSLGNANETGTALAVGAALAVGLAYGLRGKPWLQLGVIVGVPFLIYSLFLTVSRGSIVAFAAVLLAGVLVGGPMRRRIAGLAVAVAVGGVLFFGVFAHQDEHRLFESNGGTGRVDIWTVGWRMVEANPVIGVGAGNFPSSTVHYLLAPGAITRSDYIVDEPKVAHNTYLNVLAELGVIGLVLFLSIVVYSLRSALRAARTFAAAGDIDMEIVSRALLVALIGFLVASFFGSREYSKQLWLLLSLGPALLGVARSEVEELEESERGGAAQEALAIAPSML